LQVAEPDHHRSAQPERDGLCGIAARDKTLHPSGR
jgi:hypothetical protein